MCSLLRPPFGTADRPRVKGTVNGLSSLRFPIVLPSSLSETASNPISTDCYKKRQVFRPGFLTSRTIDDASLNTYDKAKPHLLERAYVSKSKWPEYQSSDNLPVLTSKPTASEKISQQALKKFERTKATLIDIHCGAPHFGSPKIRNLDGKAIAPRMPPNIRKLCDESMDNIAQKSNALEPIPQLKGRENERLKSDFLREQRIENGYLKTRMSSTLQPLARALGYRPMSSYKLAANACSLSFPDFLNRLPAQRDISQPVVAPSELCYFISSDVAVSDRDWQEKPCLMGYVGLRTIELLPQLLMDAGSWHRAVALLCNLAFLVEKSLRLGADAAHADLVAVVDGLRGQRAALQGLGCWEEAQRQRLAQAAEYRDFWAFNLARLRQDPASAY